MKTQPSKPDIRAASPQAASGRTWMPPARLAGHTLGLARDVAELESCLHLERSAPRTSTLFGVDSEGMESPSAIPFCDFLMLRDPEGDLAGVCRLLAHGPDIPVRNSLASRRYHLSPLVTAIRYSRLDMVEVGPLVVRSGSDPETVNPLLWEGIRRYIDQEGAAILLGRERLNLDPLGRLVPRLMATFGLDPELELEVRDAYRANSIRGGFPGLDESDPAWAGLPSGLKLALRHGGRLAGEPVLSADRHCLELVWVAFRDTLEGAQDWRRNQAGSNTTRAAALGTP